MNNTLDFQAASMRALHTIAEWCPGWNEGQRRNGERVIISPLRPDRSMGSFSVNEFTGKWFDFASPDDCGDACASPLSPLHVAKASARSSGQ